jgi:hypothetical protein
MGVSDCCSEAALTPDCQSACSAAKQEIPMCWPMIIYRSDVGTRSRDNAMAVRGPDSPALGQFRQPFELWRSRAEAKFQAALVGYTSGKGSDAQFVGSKPERDQVRAGRHKRVRMGLATAQSAKTAVPASVCVRNWLNAPCVVAAVKSGPATPRLRPRLLATRREVQRSKRVAQQKTARQKIAEQKVVQQKLVRIAVRTAKICTGNWVNAACAAP